MRPTNPIGIPDTLIDAIKALDDELYSLGTESLELKVIGGFALLFDGVGRGDVATDYGGRTLAGKVRAIASDIGKTHGIDPEWLNIDPIMVGSSLKDYEYAFGPMTFYKTLELNVITVSVIDTSHLLRLKTIALDTDFFSMGDSRASLRQSELDEIKNLMNVLEYRTSDLVALAEPYMINGGTLRIITEWIEGELDDSIFDRNYLLRKLAEYDACQEHRYRDSPRTWGFVSEGEKIYMKRARGKV